MIDIVTWLSRYTEYFPFAAFFALMLAGLNVPISEDLIIITGALLCRGNREQLIPTFAALFLGVIISDYFPYFIGKYIRKGTGKMRFLNFLVPPGSMEKMYHYLERFGIFTFIVCRFIPFGVRNTLFMTSGLFGLRLRRYVLYELTAATISVSTLFFLVYYFGESIKKPFHVVGVVLFVMLASAVTFIIIGIIRKFTGRRKKIQEEQKESAT